MSGRVVLGLFGSCLDGELVVVSGGGGRSKVLLACVVDDELFRTAPLFLLFSGSSIETSPE